MSSEVQRLAALVAKLQGDVASLARERRLAHASMEGGSIPVYQPGTQGKQVGVQLGEQYDGSYAPVPLGGPVPPTPSAPSAQGGVERLLVRWDGTFAAGPLTVAPQDWSRAEIHVGTTPTPGVDFTTLKGTIESPRGGEVSVAGLAPDVDYWVWLIARTQAGKFSAPSQVIGPVRVTRLTVEDIDLGDIGGNQIYRGSQAPASGDLRIGDLWLQTPDNIAHRWEGTEIGWDPVPDQRVAQALQDAFDANQAASQAGIDALAALGTANDAAETANQAASAVDAAAAQAAEAIQAASNAAALADSKVAAYYSNTAPTGLGAGDVGDLWFNAAAFNRVQRWNGSAWVDIADARVAQALQDAANAQTAAGNAQSTANTKIVTFYQDGQPSTTGRTTGDLWVDTNDGNRLYRFGGSSWTAVPFGAGAISATARQLGAITTYRQAAAPTTGMIVGDFWIDSDTNRVHRYEAGTWVAVQDVDIQTAITDAATAQAVADGKMRIFTQAAAPTGLTAADVGDMWIETDNGNKVWTWSGTAWTPRLLGNSAIEPKSLVARDVIATGTVSAALLESVLVLATTIIAGDVTGIHSRLTGTGLRVFDADGTDYDADPDEVARFGTATGDVFAIVQNGTLIGAVDRNANFSGNVGTFRDLNVAVPDWTGRGGGFHEVLDHRPRGIVGRGRSTENYDAFTVAGRGCFDITARLHFGRMYVIKVKARINAPIGNDALGQLEVRYTQSDIGRENVSWPQPPTSPNINSLLAGRFQQFPGHPTAQGTYFEFPFSLGPASTDLYRDMRFLLCFSRPVGSTMLTIYSQEPDPTEMWVEDVGPYVMHTATKNDGGGYDQVPGPVPAPQAQRFTRSWVANWHQNWGPTGTEIHGHTDAMQGPNPVNGNMRSYLGFSGTDLQGSGLTMDAALSGAVIESASVYLYSHHWHFGAGGELVLGFHGYRNPASSFGGGDQWMVGDVHFGRGDKKWVNLTVPGVDLQRFATGVWKGIMLGATTATDQLYYGRFLAENTDNSPVISVTFRR